MFFAQRLDDGTLTLKTDSKAETDMLIHLIIKGANCINGGSTNILAMAAADCVTEARDNPPIPAMFYNTTGNSEKVLMEQSEKIAQLERELFLARSVIENVRNMTINCVGDIDNAKVPSDKPTV